MNAGSEVVTMSVVEPSGSENFTASPRPSWSKSGASGLPPPLETRATTGVSAARNGARDSAAASAEGVNVPFSSVPFACTARRPECAP